MEILEGKYLESIIDKERILWFFYKNDINSFNEMWKLYNSISIREGYYKTNIFMKEHYAHIIGGIKNG